MLLMTSLVNDFSLFNDFSRGRTSYVLYPVFGGVNAAERYLICSLWCPTPIFCALW